MILSQKISYQKLLNIQKIDFMKFAIGITYSIILITILASCNGCGNDQVAKEEASLNAKEKAAEIAKFGKQLNISILWDLSDRLDPAKQSLQPSQAKRDIEVINSIVNIFKKDMDSKGAFMSKGKIKVFFTPNPNDININNLATKMDVDLTNTKEVKYKKQKYDEMSADFENAATEIAKTAIKTSLWDGSDIFRFFKNDVKDFCLAQDTAYRNILVILTDGYIYHSQSIGRVDNKTEFILPSLLSQLKLRDNANFATVFKASNCGLISTRSDLNDLEILVLGVNSDANHKSDEDVINLYLSKWFTDMKVKRYAIKNTDIPANTSKRISDFILN